MTYAGSSGVGSTVHIGMSQLAKVSGMHIKYIAYKGSAPSMSKRMPPNSSTRRPACGCSLIVAKSVLGPLWRSSGSGRSRATALRKSRLHQRGAFWAYWLPRAQAYFPEAVGVLAAEPASPTPARRGRPADRNAVSPARGRRAVPRGSVAPTACGERLGPSGDRRVRERQCYARSDSGGCFPRSD